jgi:protein CpxP
MRRRRVIPFVLWRREGSRSAGFAGQRGSLTKYFLWAWNILRGKASVRGEPSGGELRLGWFGNLGVDSSGLAQGNEETEMMTKFAGKNMKRTAAVLLCSASLMLPALAQSGTTTGGGQDQMQGPPPGGGPGGPGRRGPNPEQRLAMLTKELSLTADQSAKVKTILDDGQAKMMAERSSSASQEDRRAKMMEMRNTESANIKAVLTDDQKVKFDALQKQQMDRMREGRGNGGGNGSGAGSGTPPPPPPPPAQ